MYLHDTNVISEARRKSRPATEWLKSTPARLVNLSVISIGEIERGIRLLDRRDMSAAAVLRAWLTITLSDFQGRLLPITTDVALEWGKLSTSRARGDADGLIAATAIVHDLTIVTRNEADFIDLPLRLINPWQGR